MRLAMSASGSYSEQITLDSGMIPEYLALGFWPEGVPRIAHDGEMMKHRILVIAAVILPALGCGADQGGTLDVQGDGNPQVGVCAAPCAEGTVCENVGLAEGESCGVGDCQTELTCQAGECAPAKPICDDDNPCTQDTCDAVEGCQHQALNGGELPCGVGECRVVVVECVEGRLQECTPKAPIDEVSVIPRQIL